MGHIKDRWFTRDKQPTARHGKNPDKRYQVWITVDGHAEYCGAYRTQARARRHLVEQEAKAHCGQWVEPTDATVTECVTRYAAGRPHRASTRERWASLIRCHIEPLPFGKLRLASVRPSEVQAWITDRSAVLAPSTVQSLVKVVRGAFTAAVADRVISVSPFTTTRIAIPRVDRPRVVPLTVEQVQRLSDAMSPRYRALVLVQAGLGVRVGELIALRVDDVNFLGRTVRIERQMDRVTREHQAPKTPRSVRTLPLPTVVSQALAEHIRKFPPASDGLIFHTEAGGPLTESIRRTFPRAVRKVGLSPSTTPHDLRHHYASILLAAGESVVAVAERLGHSDGGALVLSTYGHLLPGADDRTRKAIDAAWTAPTEGPAQAATAQGRPR
ncbi:MAG: tyrosine-type recombinase/integrase [Pseudonocardiaceae bacterium]